MFIAISAGDCRTAVAAALEGFKTKLAEDRDAVREKSYDALYNGAVHNGLKPTQKDLDQMNAMANSDVEHMMEQHPANQFIEHCENLLAMLDHNDDPEVAIDDRDFRLLRKHLPAR